MTHPMYQALGQTQPACPTVVQRRSTGNQA